MTDIIDQAEAALEAVKLTGNDPVGSVGLISALLASLKAERAESQRITKLYYAAAQYGGSDV